MTFGQTFATPGMRASSPRSAVGTTTAKPFATSRYRQRTCAAGIAETMLRCAAAWAAASSRAYVRCRAEVSERPNAVSAGALRVTTTSVVGTGRAARPLPETNTAAAAAAERMITRLKSADERT